MRAFGRETNFAPKRIPNLLPSGFQGVYLASWGALIRPASYNRHTYGGRTGSNCLQIFRNTDTPIIDLRACTLQLCFRDKDII